VQLIDGISRLYDKVDSGQSVTVDDRAIVRRNQVHCAWRAVAAVDQIFARSGGNAVRSTNVMQRYWRDAHVGLQHAIHTTGSVFHATALIEMGVERPDLTAQALV
jgi:3-hydroxy-9,10-secoandrosta-1,3,5(10)-triene-9,17-dione monooxygenase